MKTIRELRETSGLTQLDLAYRLGVTPATVSLWERRQVEPRASQVRAMALVFGVSMDDIAFEAEDRQERKTAA